MGKIADVVTSSRAALVARLGAARGAGVAPTGPVFISYRQSDGTVPATDVAWALRTTGCPVWHDRADLMPGDTNKRLREALRSGIAGAVLVVTPDIAESTAVRLVELPQLRRLAKDPGFTLSIANTVSNPDGHLNYGAPDQLLRTRPGTLANLLQRPMTTAAERAEIARAHARRRVEALRQRIASAGGTLTMDVRTRAAPDARPAAVDVPMVVRPPAPGRRVPSHAGMDDLAEALAHLPQLVGLSGAQALQVTGSVHLSVAFAIGSAVPTTALGAVVVTDVFGHTWSMAPSAAHPAGPLLDAVRTDLTNGAGPVAVFVDLVSPATIAGVDELLAEHAGNLAALLTIRPVVAGHIPAGSANALVNELADKIRSFATDHKTQTVHIMLRCPWPVAFLLGRLCNTLIVDLYEYDGPGGTDRYVPSLRVRSGAGGSPITDVLLPQD